MRVKRNFKNRTWKNEHGNELEITQDGYTDNELNIWIGRGRNAVNTMIKKTALLSFSEKIKNREAHIFTDESNYDNGFFEARKTEDGYIFIVKGVFQNQMELPFEKVDKVIQYLEYNCK